ncbi:hypothetical protein B0T24DRAFT_537809, partial [Lasiosphaeria ovina]
GSYIQVQSWLAILGVGFGMLSYGLSESYIHVFDLWCSRQASRSPGLNYARYLNSQPRAPVIVGFRGFPAFVLLRYFIIVLSIPASVAYKFSIFAFRVTAYEHLDVSSVRLSLPPVQALLGNSTASPWLSDRPLGMNRAFIHDQDSGQDILEEGVMAIYFPRAIVMVGLAECGGTFQDSDLGNLYTREVVMLANRTDEVGEFVMTADQQDWARVVNVITGDPTSVGRNGLVLDYRMADTGGIQIQWAEMGSWLANGSSEQKVIKRTKYRAVSDTPFTDMP